MNKVVVYTTLAIFSLFWLGWSGAELMGSLLGDCFDDQRCLGIKKYAPGFVFWRMIAVELIAIWLCTLFLKVWKSK